MHRVYVKPHPITEFRWFTRPFLFVRGWGLSMRLSLAELIRHEDLLKQSEQSAPSVHFN